MDQSPEILTTSAGKTNLTIMRIRSALCDLRETSLQNGPLKISKLKVAGITSFQSRYILYLQCLLFMFLHPQILFHLNFTCAKAITLILRRHEDLKFGQKGIKEKKRFWCD